MQEFLKSVWTSAGSWPCELHWAPPRPQHCLDPSALHNRFKHDSGYTARPRIITGRGPTAHCCSSFTPRAKRGCTSDKSIENITLMSWGQKDSIRIEVTCWPVFNSGTTCFLSIAQCSISGWLRKFLVPKDPSNTTVFSWNTDRLEGSLPNLLRTSCEHFCHPSPRHTDTEPCTM